MFFKIDLKQDGNQFLADDQFDRFYKMKHLFLRHLKVEMYDCWLVEKPEQSRRTVV